MHLDVLDAGKFDEENRIVWHVCVCMCGMKQKE